ncbi:hypothetical protein HDU98_003724 [Podochytrium sp. JEL0797]|nr:hypothetical protein HDU98_003724 [Podochytrium sp. JEL0797]
MILTHFTFHPFANASTPANTTFPTNTTLSNATALFEATQGAQYANLGVLVGMTLEICITGIITTLIRVTLRGGRGVVTVANYHLMAFSIAMFNLACVVFQSVVAWVLFLPEEQCVAGGVVGNISAHLFYIAFDTFMLYKTFSVSHGSLSFQLGILLLLLNRLAWGIADTAKSYAIWDWIDELCVYEQSEVTGYGSISADLVVFVVCVGASVWCGGCAWWGVGVVVEEDEEVVEGEVVPPRVVTVANVLMDGNVLRSILTLGVHIYTLYAYRFFLADPIASNTALLVQMYVWARFVNAENFYSVGYIRYLRPAYLGAEKEVEEQPEMGDPSSSDASRMKSTRTDAGSTLDH